MNISNYRKLFPVVSKVIFLNNAAESPMNLRVYEALEDYSNLALNEPQNKKSPRSAIRERLATLFGGEISDYALVTSTGVGVGLVAQGFPWVAGDNIVVPAAEHWNNTFPWLALKSKGIEVRFVYPDDNERVKPEDFEKLIDNRTKIVACAAVRFNTGFRADLKSISSLAHKVGALFFVDGIQGAGVFEMNVIDLGIDIMSAAGFKWLLGLPGSGFLYINEKSRKLINPILPGMFAAENIYTELKYFEDARRYETGTIGYSLFHAWIAGLDLLIEIGVQNIHNRVIALTDIIVKGLKSRNYKIYSPIENINERSGIISFSTGNESSNSALVNKLAAKNIIVALRDGRIRVSPNFYNNEEEIEKFLENLD
ncbi:MAG: aminotransferase class V-fold PLP-dependent enzyme [Candidatus Delongbacteria bacterium]|nr:aminotransferase class V-fold PLP-dependent enzyme [Candidatus Delongbacteria bacterium]